MWKLILAIQLIDDYKADFISNTKLWLAAIKPPMYSVAIIPIWGTAVAFAESKTIHSGILYFFYPLLFFILAWMNLSNDVFDAETGIDKIKRILWLTWLGTNL